MSLPVSRILTALSISCNWNHAVFVFGWQAKFHLASCPRGFIHGVAYVRMSFFLMLNKMLYCMYIPHFAYLFIHQWTLGLLWWILCLILSHKFGVQENHPKRRMCSLANMENIEIYPWLGTVTVYHSKRLWLELPGNRGRDCVHWRYSALSELGNKTAFTMSQR